MPLSKFKKLFLFLSLAVALAASAEPAKAHGDGEQPLSEADIAESIAIAKHQFLIQYGSWLLDRSTVEAILDEDGADLEIRIHYVWGRPKFARYFCGHEIPGRLGCDRAFAGPGAL